MSAKGDFQASADKQKTAEIGAELHVRNLDPMVDEKTLYDTFSTFGNLISIPKIARNEDGSSRGFGFISYDSFEAADKAIDSMNNQYLMNKQIHVEYAFKKDGKNERHGDAAERLLAAQARKHNVQLAPAAIPPTIFAPQPTTVVPPTMPAGMAAMGGMGGMGQMNPMGMGRGVGGVPQMPMAVQPQYPPQYQMQQPPYQQPMQHMPPTAPRFGGPPTLPQAPATGLPARPPPPVAPPRPPTAPAAQAQGYPPQYSQPPALPPGFGPPNMPGLPPRPPQPVGFGAPPPPGFGPPQQHGRGVPPPPPPAGFSAYGQRR